MLLSHRSLGRMRYCSSFTSWAIHGYEGGLKMCPCVRVCVRACVCVIVYLCLCVCPS